MEVDPNLLLRMQACSSSHLRKADDENRTSANPEEEFSAEDLVPVHFKDDEKTEGPYYQENLSIGGEKGEETAGEESFPSPTHGHARVCKSVSGLSLFDETDDIDQGYSSAEEESEETPRKEVMKDLPEALKSISVSRDCLTEEADDDGLENSCIGEQEEETVREGDMSVVPEAPKEISDYASLSPEPFVVEVTAIAIDLPPGNVFLPLLPGDVP